MTNEQIQALRDKFETAVMKKICISKSTLIGLRTDEGYRNSTLSGHDYQGDWEFFLAGYSCSLAERDADKALIAELKHDVDAANARVDAGCAQLCKQDDLIATLHDACSQWERKAISNFEECAEMSARIEEIEAKLEASTVTVKLPEGYKPHVQKGGTQSTSYRAVMSGKGPWIHRDMLIEACTAAGITLVVGE